MKKYLLFTVVVLLLASLGATFLVFYNLNFKKINTKEVIKQISKQQINDELNNVIEKGIEDVGVIVTNTEINVNELLNTECIPGEPGPCFDFSCRCFGNKNLKNEFKEFIGYFENNSYGEVKKAVDILESSFDDRGDLKICNFISSCMYSYEPIRIIKLNGYQGILFYKKSGQDVNDRSIIYLYYNDGNINILEYRLDNFLEEFIKIIKEENKK